MGISYRLGSAPFFTLVALIILASFGLTLWGGSLGCYYFDQSIIFDGAWRVLNGQIPFRDFVAPVGPVIFYLQALFFKLWGVTHFAYRLHAAVLSAVLTAVVMQITLWILPGRRWLCLMTGLLTTFWFYAPLGTPWYSQDSVFFGALGLAGIFYAFRNGNTFFPARCRFHWLGPFFWAGPCMVLSFLTKQNSGAMFLLMPYILAWLPPAKTGAWRSCLDYALGLILSIALTLGLVYTFASPNLFWNHLFAIPYGTLFERLLHKKFFSKTVLFHIAFTGIVVGWLLLRWLRRAWNPRYSPLLLPLLLFTLGFVFHLGMITTSTSDAFINIPFIGLLFALLYVLMEQILALGSKAASQRLLPWLKGLLTLMVLLFCALGFNLIHSYKLKGREPGQVLMPPIPSGPLQGLRWNNPASGPISLENVSAALALMLQTPEPVYIVGGFTMLYGLSGHASVDPYLWFHEGLSFPKTYDQTMENLDQWTVRRIQTLDPKYLIANTSLMNNPEEKYRYYFAQVYDYLQNNYVFAHNRMGPALGLYQRKPGH